MTFHRFLSGPRAQITLDQRSAVDALGPVLEDNPSTQTLPGEISASGGRCIEWRPSCCRTTQARARRSTRRGRTAAAGTPIRASTSTGPGGCWSRASGSASVPEGGALQARADPGSTSPNAMDAAWQIDVRKATARPPGRLRADLKRIAEVTRRRATEVYRHRGKVDRAQRSRRTIVFVWRAARATRQGRVRRSTASTRSGRGRSQNPRPQQREHALADRRGDRPGRR